MTYRYDDIDGEVLLLEYTLDLVGQSVAHGHSATIHAHAVEDRIGAGEVDVFEHIRGQLCFGSALPAGYTVSGDDDRFACNETFD